MEIQVKPILRMMGILDASFYDDEVLLLSEQKTSQGMISTCHIVDLDTLERTKTEIVSEQGFHYIARVNRDILLVNARSCLYSDNTYDKNASLYDRDGNKKQQFLLGDGIESIQVSPRQNIWVSYFDEGIFGNCGWGSAGTGRQYVEPVGRCGIRSFYANGQPAYMFEDSDADLCDCYAMNVIHDNSVWFYYYSDFKLGHVMRQSGYEYFETDHKYEGSHGFAIYQDYVLFFGDYAHPCVLRLYKIHQRRLVFLTVIQFIDENENLFDHFRFKAQGDHILMIFENSVYLCSLKDIMESLMYSRRFLAILRESDLK